MEKDCDIKNPFYVNQLDFAWAWIFFNLFGSWLDLD